MTLRNALEDVWAAYVDAYRSADASGCAALFLPDAVLMSPYAPLAKGREAIRDVHQDWVAEGGANKEIGIVEFGGAGDLAWCLVRFSEEGTAEDGMSLNVLERQENGDWRIRMCSLNETGPDIG